MDNDPDKCPKCSGKVFDAEKVQLKNGNYHKQCFSCSLCSRKLDYSNVCSDMNDIFCNNCYLKNYGPVGVKYQLPVETGKIKPENLGTLLEGIETKPLEDISILLLMFSSQ
jgi:hypothetical protein